MSARECPAVPCESEGARRVEEAGGGRHGRVPTARQKPAATETGRDGGWKPAATETGRDGGWKPAATVTRRDGGWKPAATATGRDGGWKPAATATGRDGGWKPAATGTRREDGRGAPTDSCELGGGRRLEPGYPRKGTRGYPRVPRRYSIGTHAVLEVDCTRRRCAHSRALREDRSDERVDQRLRDRSEWPRQKGRMKTRFDLFLRLSSSGSIHVRSCVTNGRARSTNARSYLCMARLDVSMCASIQRRGGLSRSTNCTELKSLPRSE